VKCTSCDAEVPAAARFCASCGAAAPAAVGDPSDGLRTALEAALGFQYRIERLLGRGGMGAVYLAHELALDRDVAIKVLPPERGEGEDGRARFRREARTAARLSHPYIVPLLTFGEVNALAYFVMGYVRGESLAARMQREGRMAPEVVARVLSEVADALDYAHRQGFVHRDIKPDNILIDEDSGRAMLTDFGIARGRGGQNLTSTGMVVGTPRYMSPEQAGGTSDVDGRSDLYSLGLIGYEMLSGAPAFEGRTPAELLMQRLSRTPPPLHALAAGAPVWLTAAIGKCVEREVAARWSDAGAFRKQLLSDRSDGDLPVPLDKLRQCAQALGLASLIGLGYWLWSAARGETYIIWHSKEAFDVAPWVFALLMGAVLLALMSFQVRRKGYAWSAIGLAMARQPRWWPAWYPRIARAPGDVWSRLPQHVRLVRGLVSSLLVFVLVFLLAITIQTELQNSFVRTGAWLGPVTRSGWEAIFDCGQVFPILLLGTFALALWSFRRLRAGALAAFGEEESAWMVYARPTGDSRFWSKPGPASLLSPLAALPRAARTDGPTTTHGGDSRSEAPTRTRG